MIAWLCVTSAAGDFDLPPASEGGHVRRWRSELEPGGPRAYRPVARRPVTGGVRIPRVWVAGADREKFEAAVRQGGGETVPAKDANAIIWAADEPAKLQVHLHRGVQWVQLWSAGVEEWIAAGVIDDRRQWTAARGVYAEPIAEYVLTMLLAAARSLGTSVQATSGTLPSGRALQGSTVGIVGAGAIGSALIALLGPLRVRTLALTRTGRTVRGATVSVGVNGLGRLLSESDYVVLAAPQTSETAKLISVDQLALMRPTSWLINVGRGSLVETDALVDALRGRRIAGAALDVTDPEPLPPGHPLWSIPNTIITGHTACPWDLGRTAFAKRVQANVERFASDRDLLGLVNSRVGY